MSILSIDKSLSSSEELPSELCLILSISSFSSLFFSKKLFISSGVKFKSSEIIATN